MRKGDQNVPGRGKKGLTIKREGRVEEDHRSRHINYKGTNINLNRPSKAS